MRAKTILTVLFLISVGVAGFVFLRALPQTVDAANAPPPEEVLVAKVPLATAEQRRVGRQDDRFVAGGVRARDELF